MISNHFDKKKEFSKRIPEKLKDWPLHDGRLLNKELRDIVSQKMKNGEQGWHELADTSVPGGIQKIYINQDNEAFVCNENEVFLLGEGGSGRAYITQHAITGKWHFMKILKGVLQEVEVEMLMKEGMYLSSQKTESTDLLVGELIQGDSLKKFIEKNELSFEQAFALSISLVEAYESLHGKGYVHGDIYPDNIIVNKEQLKCIAIDFGLSKKVPQATGENAYAYKDLGVLKPANFQDDIHAIGGVVANNILCAWMNTSQTSLTSEERALAAVIARMQDSTGMQYGSLHEIINKMREIREKYIETRMGAHSLSSENSYNSQLKKLYADRESLINTFSVFLNQPGDENLSEAERKRVQEERTRQRESFLHTSHVLDALDNFLLRCLDEKSENRPSEQELNQYINKLDQILASKKSLMNTLHDNKKAKLKPVLRKDSRTENWLAAFRQGEKAIAKLAKNDNVNAPLPNGYTVVYLAAKHGYAAAIKILQDLGADVNTLCNGYTPVFVAATEGHAETIKALHAAKADVNTPCNGYTPVYVAAAHGHAEAIKALQATEAKTDVPSIDGFTPICIAAEKGYKAAIKALIDAGADVNTPSESGFTLLYIAAQKGHAEIIRELVKAGADVNKRTPSNNYTPIYIAATHGHVEAIRALIAAGADVNQSCRNFTPLYFAASHGRTEVIMTLKAAGADMEKALFIAAKSENIKAIETLIKAGANMEKALFMAAKSENIKAIETLIKAGANMEKALFMAAKSGSIRAIESLVKAGADMAMPLRTAVESGDIAVIETLRKAGANVQASFRAAVDSGNVAAIKALGMAGTDMNMPMAPSGVRPLHIALLRRRIEVITELIAVGADVNVLSALGTPLNVAVKMGNIAAITALILAGASVNTPVLSSGWTPLHTAANLGNLEAIQALIGANADANAQDKDGKTPLDLAIAGGHIAAIAALKEASARTTQTLSLSQRSTLRGGSDG